MGFTRSAALLLPTLPVVLAGDTCLSQGQLFGVIFGSVGAAFLISAGIGIMLWVFLRKARPISKTTEEKAAYANDTVDVENRGTDIKKPEVRNKMTKIDSFMLKKKLEDVGTQKAYSMEHLNEVNAKIGVQLNGEDIGGLGFNIQGNMNEGIFVQKIVPRGIAEDSGNILVGDRIKSLTISFENMVYEDAVTLLSYASPYKVKLELERKMEESNEAEVKEEEKELRYHPFFRSNTLTHVHFNPYGSIEAAPKPIKCSSEDSTQKFELVKRGLKSIMNQFMYDSDDLKTAEPDSTNEDNVNSVMESSDYGSDGVSEGKGSDVSSSTQKTLSDHVEITTVISDKIKSPQPSPRPKLEKCVEMPPKQRKVVSRSPSPKLISKPPPSPRVNKATSPPVQVPSVDDSTQTKEKNEEVKEVQTEVELAPVPPPVSSIPTREKKEAPHTKLTKHSSIPTHKDLTREVNKAPEITETRVSRIPKRNDSTKTPIIERKLPSLPKPLTQRSQSAEKGENVWSRLYLEKKGNLKKTRDVTPTNSALPSPGLKSPTSIRARATSCDDNKYGTLTREKRDRLEANDAELERQKEELRKLGVL